MIVLVGFMGAGKTTIGRLVADALGLPFVDTDALIEAEQGMAIADLFALEGQRGFRPIESRIAAEALSGPEAVVALGGGAVNDPVTCSALEWATVVLLEVSFGEALRRARSEGVERPMLSSHDPKALFDERRGIYERIADLRVVTDGRRPVDIAGEVVTAIGSAERAPEDFERVPVRTDPPYEVFVGYGIATRVAELCPAPPDAETVVVMHQPTLGPVAGKVADTFQRIGLGTHLVELDDGEQAKTLHGAEALFERLVDAGVHRHDVLVAVGGGAATDVVGFVASTFNRGMPVIHVPTSLLAQVDAAVGGKTAVNLSRGKNLVGTFHQPIGVVCDVEVLRSLPEDEFVSGLAEVVKYGLIADPSLLDLVGSGSQHLRNDDGELRALVTRSIAIKAGIVARDEKEMGQRAWLNYGHTFAHAIEHAMGYGTLRHGEAVALGMMAAAYTAEELGRLDRSEVEAHERALSSAGLPTAARLDLDALEEAWSHDKKYRAGVRFVLLSGIGRPEAGVRVPRAVLTAAIERMATEA